MIRLGAVTVGQSPRIDVTPDLAPLLPGVALLERGALDGLAEDRLAELAGRADGAVLATRLRDGREIVVAERDVVPRVQAALDELAGERVAAVLLLCTGAFPPLRCPVPLLRPDRILQAVARAVFEPPPPATEGGVFGVLTPNAAQRETQRARWSRLLGAAVEVRVEAVTPYRTDPLPDLRAAARRLRAAGATMAALDCLGYDRAMRDAVRAELGAPVLLARTVLARAAAELVGA